MKRVKHLWEQVCSWENLLLAHRKARRGKRQRDEVATFELNRELELRALQRELRDHRYAAGPYRQFTIYDRKPRTISAAPYRDRVVHHALMNVVEPRLDRRFIDHCFACRPGRGVHAAVNAYQRYAGRYAYAVKLDVMGYFASIDHARLKVKLAARIDDRDILWLFGAIIDSAPSVTAASPMLPGEDLIDVMQRRTGLPIGNLTSQFLGNLYLDDLDHFIKESLRIPAYLRYVDDLFLLGDDKRVLRSQVATLAERLAAERLVLHPCRQQVVPVSVGIDVLGYRVWPNFRRLRAENGYRCRRRLKRLAQAYRVGRVQLLDVRARVASWIGHAIHGASAAFIDQVLGSVVFSRGAGT